MKQDWKIYFSFSKKELKGITVIGLVILISIALKYFFPQKPAKGLVSHRKPPLIAVSKLFTFDPNLIDSNQALLLGFTSKQFHTLSKYRTKGGRFKKPEDIAKLYGLSEEQVQQWIPFIRIEKKESYKKGPFYMRYQDWEALGIFNKKQIWQLMSLSRRKGRVLSWKEIVIQFDLTKEEASILKNKINIKD